MDRLLLREDLEDAPPSVAGRTLTIRICTYDRIYRLGNGQRERIRRGAFREPLARPRGALRFRHVGERPGDDDALDNFYGTMTALRESDDGTHVLGDFEVFAGEREDKLLRLVQSGAVTGASMAAVIREQKLVADKAGAVTDILRISHLDGVSITPRPSYADAGVLAVREQPADKDSAARRAARIAEERAYWATVALPGR